jgi:hypothetical protein
MKIEPHYPHSSCKKIMSFLVGFMINQVLGFGGLGFLAHSSCNNIYELVGKVYGLTKFMV